MQPQPKTHICSSSLQFLYRTIPVPVQCGCITIPTAMAQFTTSAVPTQRQHVGSSVPETAHHIARLIPIRLTITTVRRLQEVSRMAQLRSASAIWIRRTSSMSAHHWTRTASVQHRYTSSAVRSRYNSVHFIAAATQCMHNTRAMPAHYDLSLTTARGQYSGNIATTQHGQLASPLRCPPPPSTATLSDQSGTNTMHPDCDPCISPVHSQSKHSATHA